MQLYSALLLFFFRLALVAKVRSWSPGPFYIDISGVLRTILAPVPSIRWGRLNIRNNGFFNTLHHSFHPLKKNIIPELIFFIFLCQKPLRLILIPLCPAYFVSQKEIERKDKPASRFGCNFEITPHEKSQ